MANSPKLKATKRIISTSQEIDKQVAERKKEIALLEVEYNKLLTKNQRLRDQLDAK